MVIEKGADGGFYVAGGAEAAAADLLLGEGGKPAFDQVEPTGGGGREVNMEARAFEKPAPDGRGLVSGIIVHREMHVQLRRHMVFDGVEEPAELHAAVATVYLADDFAGCCIESREQAGGAVAEVVMSAAFGVSRAHRQQRGGSLQSLNLALLIDAQDQSVLGRVQVEADDVPHLVDKQRVMAQLKALGAVWLEGKGAPDAADGGLVQPRNFGHGARGPMRGIGGLALQGPRDDRFDLRIAY